MKINELSIKSFRGLVNARFENLSRVNYIVGVNNSGKTSVIEAIVTGGCYSNVNMLTDTVFARSQKRFLEGAKNMLKPQKSDNSIVSIKYDDGHIISTTVSCIEDEKIIQEDKKILNTRLLTVSFECKDEFGDNIRNESFWLNFEHNGKRTSLRKDPLIAQKNLRSIPCQFISFSRFDRTDKLLEALDNIFLNNKKEELLKILKIFDPDVTNFEVIGDERQILVFRDGENSGGSLYLNDYGNGMYKAFYIACAAILSENGILLVDELEAGIHHKALEEFVFFLNSISLERNIQLFITTHSLELLDIAGEIHDDNAMNIYNVKMRPQYKETKVKLISKEDFDYLRKELGVDIR